MKSRIIYIHGNQTTHWSFSWVEKLKPTVINIPGAKHFIERETFPEVLAHLVENYK